ncbi:MAG: hypothetical protein ABJA71_01825 [Ginsengibacter sp.]
MIARILLDLIHYPAFRRIIWKPVYKTLAKRNKVAGWHFTNYHYVSVMRKNIFISALIFLFLGASSQNDFALRSRPKKIWVYNDQGNLIKGIFVGSSDSSVNIFPGKLSEWNSRSKTSVVNQSYLNINNIKIHKKSGLVSGMLLGAGVSLLPVLVGSIFGQSTGQGGCYVSIITFPAGLITGAIIGGTSKKRFLINGEALRFHAFHKCMKY